MEIAAQKTTDGVTLRVLDSRIDAAATITFKERMRELLSRLEGPVLLDLAKVDFIDSSGLGAIVGVHKTLATTRGLTLTNLTPAVAQVFRLTHLDEVIAIAPSPEAFHAR